MNTETGRIVSPEEFINLSEEAKEIYIPVLNKDMTKKQVNTKQVSLRDYKSKLGKQLHQHRRQARIMQRSGR